MADDDFDVDEKVNEKMFDSVSIKFCQGQGYLSPVNDKGTTGLYK